MPKTAKGGARENKGFVTTVNPYKVEVKQALTSLKLLTCEEDQIVFLSICTLDAFITKYGKNALVYLQEQDLLQKLFDCLQKVIITRKIAGKILVKLLQLENILSTIQNTPSNITILITWFLTAEDETELEYSSLLLSLICVPVTCSLMLCREDIIKHLFTTIVTSKDPDIKQNCLKIVLNLVHCDEMRYMLADCLSSKIQTLHLVLQGPFAILQPVTVQIFHVISSWDNEILHNQLFDNRTCIYMFEILSNEDWTDMQNNALGTILNCFKYHSVQISSIESTQFLNFVNVAKDASQEHALACVALIGELALQKENRTVMLDLRIHEYLDEYCKFNCDMIYIKFCEAVSEFCRNCHVIKELANRSVIKNIERLMRKTELPWIPYRQAGIVPLYLFLMANPELGILFYKTNILTQILNLLLNRKEVEKSKYKMALEMFETLLTSKCLHMYLWSQKMYYAIVHILLDSETELVKKAIEIIKSTLPCSKYREWFLEANGAEVITRMVCKRNCDYLDEAITLCKFASRYEEICINLMCNGLIPVMQDLASRSPRHEQVCLTIVDDIYKCELSIKFHDTWFLDYHDITKNGFCAYIGYRPRTFPPEMAEDMSKYSFTSTIITANFQGKHKQLPAAIGVPGQLDPGSAKSGSKTSVASLKLIYKLDLPIPTTDPKTDVYLKRYLKQAIHLVYGMDNATIFRKISALAKFVVSCLNGYEGKLPTKHQYETHVMELKKKLRSNYIPIGYFRFGGMMERALLFKVLADRVEIPATLRRTSDFCAWNEITVSGTTPFCVSGNMTHNALQKYVVDLMEDIGTLLLVGQRNTDLYCEKSQHYNNNLQWDISLASTNTTVDDN